MPGSSGERCRVVNPGSGTRLDWQQVFRRRGHEQDVRSGSWAGLVWGRDGERDQGPDMGKIAHRPLREQRHSLAHQHRTVTKQHQAAPSQTRVEKHDQDPGVKTRKGCSFQRKFRVLDPTIGQCLSNNEPGGGVGGCLDGERASPLRASTHPGQVCPPTAGHCGRCSRWHTPLQGLGRALWASLRLGGKPGASLGDEVRGVCLIGRSPSGGAGGERNGQMSWVKKQKCWKREGRARKKDKNRICWGWLPGCLP